MDPLRAFTRTEVAMLFVLFVTLALIFTASSFVVQEERTAAVEFQQETAEAQRTNN